MRLFNAYNADGLLFSHDQLITYTRSSKTQTYELPEAKDSKVVCANIDCERDLLVCAYDNKWICSYKLSDGSVLQSVCLKKCPSAITIAIWEEKVVFIVSDKAGEIFTINSNDFTRQFRVGGHTGSIITDIELVQCTHNGKENQQYLVSCDRDEHIRFSQFPHMCNIESYCVGHKSIITSVSSLTVSDNSGAGHSNSTSAAISAAPVLLVSASWDHKICLWKCPTGQLLDTVVNPFKPDAVVVTEEESEVLADQEGDDAAEPQEEATEADAADNEEEEERGGDDYHNGKYDSEKAVNVPLKVVAASVGGVQVAAVMYRHCKSIHLLSIRPTTENNSSCASSFEFGESCMLELDQVPADICFQTDASLTDPTLTLLVMMPEPSYVVPYDVKLSAASSSEQQQKFTVSKLTQISPVVVAANLFYKNAGLKPSQAIMDSHIGASDQVASGINKHVLDKPFNKSVMVKITTSSRNKSRSRGKGRHRGDNKRKIDEVAGEGEGKDQQEQEAAKKK